MKMECSMPDCHDEPRTGQRYCPACHRIYMKAWRAKKKMQQEGLIKELLLLRKQVRELRASH